MNLDIKVLTIKTIKYMNNLHIEIKKWYRIIIYHNLGAWNTKHTHSSMDEAVSL